MMHPNAEEQETNLVRERKLRWWSVHGDLNLVKMSVTSVERVRVDHVLHLLSNALDSVE